MSPDAGSSDALITGKVGEEVKSAKMSVKVNKVVDPVPTKSGDLFTPAAGKHWVALNMTVTNLDSKPLSFSPMMCLDAKTDKNTKADTSLLAQYGSPFSSSTLQQGDTSAGDVVFEVPSGDSLKQLDVSCLDFSSTKQTIRINLK